MVYREGGWGIVNQAMFVSDKCSEETEERHHKTTYDEPVFIVGVGPATAHVPTPWHYTIYMCSSRSVAMVMGWLVMVGGCSGDVWFRLVAQGLCVHRS